MARQPVNMVDAVAEVIPRMARSRSAVIRIGTIPAGAVPVATPDNGWLMPVTIGGGTINAAFGVDYYPRPGDQVAVINDRDMWLILYKLATSIVATGYDQPLAQFSWGGGTSVVTNSSQYVTSFADSGNRGQPWKVRSGDASYLDCVVPGLYMFWMWWRAWTPTSRTSGYIQPVVEGAGGNWEFLVPQGGSNFADAFSVLPFMGGSVGSYIRIRMNNFTGANITPDRGMCAFLRVGNV